jgi:hypothetical protein
MSSSSSGKGPSDDKPSDMPATELPNLADLPFPSSLCHRCESPRYIRSGRGSVFILCPLLPQKYPPQPVRSCPLFRPRSDEGMAPNAK